MSITISAATLKEMLEIAAPDKDQSEQLETEITLFVRDKEETSVEGDPLPAGVYFYISEYPEEGCYGPF